MFLPELFLSDKMVGVIICVADGLRKSETCNNEDNGFTDLDCLSVVSPWFLYNIIFEILYVTSRPVRMFLSRHVSSVLDMRRASSSFNAPLL